MTNAVVGHAPAPAMQREHPESIRVVHNAVIDPRYKRWIFLESLQWWGCCKVEEAFARTYFEVHENKIEFNRPIANCCCVIDATDVVYFDRDRMRNVYKAGFCRPCPMLFPTCCDLCGEGLVLESGNCKCCKPAVITADGVGAFCCRSWSLLLGFENAQKVADHINAAKAARPEAGKMS